MSNSETGWPRRRLMWIVGVIVLFGLGAIVGQILGNVWVGILIALPISIGWIIAYESWRGRNVGYYDRDDNGAQL